MGEGGRLRRVCGVDLVRETGRGIARYRGRYDTEVATPRCLPPRRAAGAPT